MKLKDLPGFISGVPSKSEMIAQLQEMDERLKQSLKVQNSLVLQINDVTQKKYVGNEYRSYENAIAAIQKKYNATAEWGTTLTGNIIDLRAAFIIQDGLKVVVADGVEKEQAMAELQWATDFFQYNKLDRELTHTLATEAEIEGKIAFKIAMEQINDGWKDYDQMVTIRYISYLDKKYEIFTSAEDYMDYEKLAWKPKANDRGETLSDNDFVYNKFGGRITEPNTAQPKIMKCLTQIDDVDKALRDWREINHIFATPILDVECDDDTAVQAAKAQLDQMNMKIKKAFIHAGSKAQILGPDMAGVNSLENEIVSKIKIISGVTAIPVHFIGLLDLLKNRSTGESTREMVISATTKERKIWEGTYNEVVEKAMMKYNGNVSGKKSKQSQLDPTKIKVIISVYTQEQWDHIEKVLLPMYLADALSIEYLLSQVPDLNVESEMKKLDQKKEEKKEKEDSDLADQLGFGNPGFNQPPADDAIIGT